MEEDQLELFDEPVKEITLAEFDANIEHYKMLRDRYKEADSIAKAAHADMREAEAKILEMLDSTGKKSYTVDGVGMVTRAVKMSVPTPKSTEDRKAFFDYIKDKYGEDVMWSYASVNSNTLNKFYNEEVDEALKQGTQVSIKGIELPTERVTLQFRSK